MRIALHILVIVLFLTHIIIYGGYSESMTNQYDISILNTLKRLDCPFTRENISDSRFCPYEAIQSDDITLVKSWAAEDGTIELFAGAYGGYLAILRKENKILCAQYINRKPHNTLENEYFRDHQIYFYDLVVNGSGIYGKSRIAYFIDGSMVAFLFYSPTDTKPVRFFTSSSSCLIPYD